MIGEVSSEDFDVSAAFEQVSSFNFNFSFKDLFFGLDLAVVVVDVVSDDEVGAEEVVVATGRALTCCFRVKSTSDSSSTELGQLSLSAS